MSAFNVGSNSQFMSHFFVQQHKMWHKKHYHISRHTLVHKTQERRQDNHIYFHYYFTLQTEQNNGRKCTKARCFGTLYCKQMPELWRLCFIFYMFARFYLPHTNRFEDLFGTMMCGVFTNRRIEEQVNTHMYLYYVYPPIHILMVIQASSF